PKRDQSLPRTVIAAGGVVPKGLEGMRARDPGSPPAIFLLVTPSPRQQQQEAAREAEEGNGPLQEDPHREGQMSELRENEVAGTASRAAPAVVSGSPQAPPLNGVRGEGESSEASLQETSANAEAVMLDEGDFNGKSGKGEKVGGAENKEKEGEEEEEDEEGEEAEILTCLWTDQPGAAVPKTAGDYASVVLQEVLPRDIHAADDSTKPVPGGRVILRMRQNPELNGLPLTATSAKVRLVKGGAPRIFRVILQPSLGCCVGFSCTHDIETGDAGGIWAEAGFSQVTETGKYEGARPGEWKVLFRRAFRVAAKRPSVSLSPPPAEEDPEGTKSGGTSAGNRYHEQLPTHQRTALIAVVARNEINSKSPSEEAATSHSIFVKAILHLPDEESRPSVSLAFIDEDTGREMIQPSLHTNMLPLKPNGKGYSVLAVACSRAREIPKGAWRLQLLSDRPLLPLEPDAHEGRDDSDPSSKPLKVFSADSSADAGVDEGEGKGEGQGGSATTVVPCQNRVVYGGIYVPNKYLLLFRDILTCTSPLPFAVRLRGSISAVPDMRLRLRFLDAVTGETLRDIRGHHLLQALAITPPPAPPAEDPSNPPTKETPAKEKGGAKDKAAVAEHATPAPGKMIVEASLDWEKMEVVPPQLMSELPHCFQATPEGLVHFCPPSSVVDAIPRNFPPRTSSSNKAHELGDHGLEGSGEGGAGDSRKSLCTEPPPTVRSSKPSSISRATAEAAVPSKAAAPGSEIGAAAENLDYDVTGPISPDGASRLVGRHDETRKDSVSWWLEIAGAEEVEMSHDTARMEKENREVESWEARRPGRAARAALVWTQRQASKVAYLGSAENPPMPLPSSSAGATAPEMSISANPSPSEDGYEDWIKARAVAVGVPVALEKERQASRLALSKSPVTRVTMPVAPSSGSSFLVAGPQQHSSSAPSALFVGDLEMKKRAEERAALREATAEFEKKWEADRVDKVEAGKEQMSMQLLFIRGREEKIKEARLPFLRDREKIVQDLIAKAERRKQVLEEERAALEPVAKGAKAKQAKGKSGKK
ncbi:unnamed protein product, partial [Hapterophycus canaliculatus]